MSASADTSYQQLCDHTRETALLGSIFSLLHWDERTLLPPEGASFRAEQITLLASLMHRRRTDPVIAEWLDELSDSPLAADPHSDTGTVVRRLRRTYEKQVKLPQRLVEEIARASVEGQQIWQRARAEDDFASFAPILKKIVELKREQSDAIGFDECRYDALLDDYEPEEKTSNVRRVLGGLRDDLVPVIKRIAESDRRPDLSILQRHFPGEAQQSFGRAAAEEIGFDFRCGRLDETVHPFCSGLTPGDTRITTRYDEGFFPSGFFSILHEAGHGMYEQGLRGDMFGLPPGESVSLGIHESQSRMWENQVGRSRAYWDYKFDAARQAFPDALRDVNPDEFFFAINDVRPSLIRVEADEATYNLHILIRFELEQDLIDDRLSVDDLPAAWNDKYESYLGIQPPNDADGVLQDIHWSGASIGYFSTYSLGNLYAAQFFATADKELGGLDAMFRRGDFDPLRKWLNENIHQQGECYSAAELVERVTGEPLSHRFLLDNLMSKLGPLYDL